MHRDGFRSIATHFAVVILLRHQQQLAELGLDCAQSCHRIQIPHGRTARKVRPWSYCVQRRQHLIVSFRDRLLAELQRADALGLTADDLLQLVADRASIAKALFACALVNTTGNHLADRHSADTFALELHPASLDHCLQNLTELLLIVVLTGKLQREA